MHNLRLALRTLIHSRAFTAISLLTLALGIGVNTSMFSLVDALLFRSGPFPEPRQLVQLAYTTRGGETRGFSEQEIREIEPQASGLTSLTSVSFTSSALSEPGMPAERISGIDISAGWMDTFRVQPAIGRSFSAEEFQPGKNQVVILSDPCWRARFGADRNVAGRTMRLDGETVTIIGVMPAGFEYRLLWGNCSYWRPINYTPDQLQYRAYRNFNLIGRLKSEASPSSVSAQLTPLGATQEKNFPQDYPGIRYRAISLTEALMDDVGRGISWTLLGLSGFILLIACANLANLQLARATAATRDFAIRAALGASRAHLVRQQLTESVLLSLAGGTLGVVVALWVNSLLERNILLGNAPGLDLRIDRGILLLTFLVSVFTGLLFGIVPALFASRANVSSALKQQSRGATAGRGHHVMRQLLIVGEVALALVLLGGAAVMNRGFSKFLQREVGWNTSRVLTATFVMPEARFDTPEKRIEFYRRIETVAAAVPGVEHASLSTSLPLFNYTSDRQVFVDAPGGNMAENPFASHVMITSDYFATLGIPILQGQTFSPTIKRDDPQYILVNESLAKRFWPNESAIGKRLGVLDNGKTAWQEIIGVVGDVQSAANFTDKETPLQVYRSLVHEPWSYVNLAVRSAHPGAITDPLRRAIAAVEPDLPADDIGTVRQFVDRNQHNLVVIGQTLVGFALLGLVLAAVGLYGVISNVVAQRTTEFGIRLALGARPQDVLTNVLRGGAILAVAGTVLGLGGAYGLARLLGHFMPLIASPDPLALTGVAVVLLVVTLVSCWFPARRATKVDPMIALRAE